MENLNFKFASYAIKSTMIKKIMLAFCLMLFMGTLTFAQTMLYKTELPIDTAVAVTSGNPWQSFTLSTQTGTFTAEFDVVPNDANLFNAVTGIQNGTPTSWGDLACIVRFNAGLIDARNGGAYSADTTVHYTVGTSYHFRFVINIPAHTYSIYVTPSGQSEITLGSDYAFRAEQASVAQLTGWSLQISAGTHTVSNMTFTPSTPTVVAANLKETKDLIKVHPNPFNTNFNIIISPGILLNDTRMNIYNLSGKEVRNAPINSHQTVVERGELKSGMYFYSIINNNEIIENGKLVVQ